MRKLFIILTLCIGFLTVADAQTFTQRLQKSNSGEGQVTIHHDKAIDELVNGTGKAPNKQTSAQQTATNQKKDTKPEQKSGSEKEQAQRTPENNESDTPETPTIDTRKKVMLNSYKTDGYRVQVYAGGNSRKNRQEAEQAGNTVKMNFPEEPIYVHFYAPRWICRIGNYRTYEEAHAMLQNIKKLGFEQATIVKGKISVSY